MKNQVLITSDLFARKDLACFLDVLRCAPTQKCIREREFGVASSAPVLARGDGQPQSLDGGVQVVLVEMVLAESLVSCRRFEGIAGLQDLVKKLQTRLLTNGRTGV